MPFEVFYETPVFSENGVAHSIHNSTGIQGVKWYIFTKLNSESLTCIENMILSKAKSVIARTMSVVFCL